MLKLGGVGRCVVLLVWFLLFSTAFYIFSLKQEFIYFSMLQLATVVAFYCFLMFYIGSVVLLRGDAVVGFNLLHVAVRHKAHLMINAPTADDLSKRAAIAYFEDFVGASVFDHNSQGFFFFASKKLSFFKGGAALLPGPQMIRLVGDKHKCFPRQNIEGFTEVEQSGWIVNVAAVIPAAFDHGWIRFKNHIL
jgi:hypothetical protein